MKLNLFKLNLHRRFSEKACKHAYFNWKIQNFSI